MITRPSMCCCSRRFRAPFWRTEGPCTSKRYQVLLAACIVGASEETRADFKTWTGGATGTATSWSAAGNWSPAIVPVAGDNINLYGISSASATVNYDYAPALTFASLTVSHSNPSDMVKERSTTLNISSFNFSSVVESIGDSRTTATRGWGIVNQTGATNTVVSSNPLLVGVLSGQLGPDSGTYNLSAGNLISPGGLILGLSGQGTFNQTGGSVSLGTSSLTLGQNLLGTGLYTLNAGSITAGSAYLGAAGKGTLTQTGGYALFADSLTLASASTGTGSFSFSGGTFFASTVYVGFAGTGAFTQNGGTMTSGIFSVANNAGSSGTVNINSGYFSTGFAIIGTTGIGIMNVGAGSTFDVGGNGLTVGSNTGASGLLTVAAGAQVNVSNGTITRIAFVPNTSGTITLNGAGAALRTYVPANFGLASTLSIGSSGRGVLNIFNGAIVELFSETSISSNGSSVNVDGITTLWKPGNLSVGGPAGSITVTGGTVLPTSTSIGSGILTLNGTGSTWMTPSTFIGFGTGTLNITNGASYFNDGGPFSLAPFSPSSRGVLIVDGPGSRLTSNVTIDFSFPSGGPGSLQVTNGATALVHDLVDNGAPVSTITLDGGILDLQGFQIGPTSPIDSLNLRAGTLRNVAQINAGTTGLVKIGPGTLLLNTPNTYTGGTYLQQGTLVIAHSTALNNGNLILSAGSRAVLQLGPTGVSHFINLALSGSNNNWTAQFDLTSSALIFTPLPNSKGGVIAQFRNQIATAYNGAGGGGAWTGNGITASTIPFSPGTFLALADNADLHLSSFRGITLTSNDLILVQALLGDANLDQKVDAFDLNLLASHWQQNSATTLWSAGDFNLDNKVDSFDLNILAAHWQQSGDSWSAGDFTADGKVDAFDLNLIAGNWQYGTASSMQGALAENPVFGGAVAVPEPVSLAVLALGGAALLTCRRQVRV